MTSSALLTLRDTSLVYRARPVLQNINWTLLPGQQWACLGPNGAGKTSLAKIISRQEQHAAGTIARSPSLEEKGVAYVCFEQQKALCDRDKKLDDSEFRADASDPGTRVCELILAGHSLDDRFDQWVERLQIGHILDRGLRFISTGEMRRTLLVKAILSDPGLLILDSPLDGLDLASQSELRQIIDELLHSELPVFLLCRALEDVPAGVSHILALDGGHIVASGPRDLVMPGDVVQTLMKPPITDLEALPVPAPRPYQLPAQGPLLDLHRISVSYGDLAVLRDVAWRCERGQHC